MSSFKLAKGGSPKKQAVSVGGLLIVLGVLIGFLLHPFGWGVAGTGLIAILGGLFASE